MQLKEGILNSRYRCHYCGGNLVIQQDYPLNTYVVKCFNCGKKQDIEREEVNNE